MVWSDDDTTLLIAERDFAYHGDRETSTTRLLLLDPAPGARTVPLGEPRVGEVVDLYLMMGGAYALAWFEWIDGTSDLVQFFLDGDERLLVVEEGATELSDCRRGAAIPSPNAEMIGVEFECESGGWITYEHVIIDAFSGETVVRLPDTGLGIGLWTPAGDYVVASAEESSLHWIPGTTEADMIPSPTCISPRTTSSPVKENGEYVAMADVLEPPYVEYYGALSRRTPFGCP